MNQASIPLFFAGLYKVLYTLSMYFKVIVAILPPNLQDPPFKFKPTEF